MENTLTITFDAIESYDHLDATEKKLFDTAKNIREIAYAPYSNFTVGCAVLLENGEIISGSNQENAAYPSGLCAERTAIFWIGANFPDVKIKKLFVIGAPREALSSVPIPPCGACRQSILEYESKQQDEIEVYFASLDGAIYKTKSIRDLLPFSFDASYL
ncbi:cytidine deaminase [Kaistella palustris]|uniref:cytidine deaminase n=1 Tax=Kaistella palustris TaxID=493376 RepID=UPI0003FCCAD0|nr:cytidine deaminase [Kaistella palustris]